MTTWVDPRTWVANVTHGTAAIMNEIRDALRVMSEKPPTYTPALAAGTGWTSNTVAAGTVRTAGKRVEFTVTVTFTGAPAGSGGVLVSLPSTPSADYNTWVAIGDATARDISTGGSTGGTAVWAGTAGGVPYVSAYFGATRLANAAPYTFATGDYVQIQGWYYTD